MTKKAHLIGVGGAGVSAIAKYLFTEGYQISGSDTQHTDIIQDLQDNYSLTFFNTQEEENITEDIDILVYTPAVGPGNLEYDRAIDLEVVTYSYPEFLGYISQNKITVAIAGTNGKTTTTSMIGEALDDLSLDPTIIVGGVMARYKSNYRKGESDLFIVEACEYKESFLHLHPDVIVLTNITPDHLDYFKNKENYRAVFKKFIDNLKPDGIVICDSQDDDLDEIIEYALSKEISVLDAHLADDSVWDLKIPGIYNRQNAQKALRCVEHLSGREESEIIQYINTYSGTARRFQYVGVTEYGTPVYDDYGHNPEAIDLLVAGVREFFPDRKIVIVFQAHLHSRTHAFFDDFVDALSEADELYMLPIYKARTEDDFGVSSKKLGESIIKKRDVEIHYSDSVEELSESFPLEKYNTDSIIITLGAGQTDIVAAHLVE